jgi:RNA polymerase sigma-70 factor, ECF subfamily
MQGKTKRHRRTGVEFSPNLQAPARVGSPDFNIDAYRLGPQGLLATPTLGVSSRNSSGRYSLRPFGGTYTGGTPLNDKGSRLEFSPPLRYYAAVKRPSEGGGARRETFAREVMVYLDHLYRVALHLARDEEEAQDLTQETFARALASYDQFRPGTNMKAWLTKILQNFFFDRYQQRKRWVSTDDPAGEGANLRKEPAAQNSGLESHVLSAELSAEITDVLKKIPPEFRVPIVLVDMGDFSYAEAAEMLSCPVGTIRSRLSRGRKLMRSYLGDYLGFEQPRAKNK